ncbi:MAG: D-lactate dehydrogenase [Phormidesmis priestleyi Ana]|uniref:D-lactate dehydrogenase n=1 Tax=Phormidesmis priestleyi Ana TaxID=1666911 RepID=A0A0P7ZTW7_9CYAN|nr:MAG: D-lactate dehydrogenase [Phormidesmis priestleyi Ana]
MKVAVFSAKPYDRKFLTAANIDHAHELVFLEARLTPETAALAGGFPAVCAFINDQLNQQTLGAIAASGTELIALRAAGFNNVDLQAASELNLTIVRVPEYSPYAVAEHAVGLILMLNRKLNKAYNRVRDDNFALDGLLGFDLHGSTVGVIGTGKIGQIFCQIMTGFGCHVLAYDPYPNPACLEMGVEYRTLPDLLATADIISLHCPLMPETYHLLDQQSLSHLKPGAMVINTSRGGLIDTKAVIKAIKTGQIGYLGIDVYEQEENLFFEDWSNTVVQDDDIQRLQSFNNVVITAHQAFFTREALTNIAKTTMISLTQFERGEACEYQIHQRQFGKA